MHTAPGRSSNHAFLVLRACSFRNVAQAVAATSAMARRASTNNGGVSSEANDGPAARSVSKSSANARRSSMTDVFISDARKAVGDRVVSSPNIPAPRPSPGMVGAVSAVTRVAGGGVAVARSAGSFRQRAATEDNVVSQAAMQMHEEVEAGKGADVNALGAWPPGKSK